MPHTAFAHRAPWMLSRRSTGLRPSAIRDILRSSASPGMISLAGGLPAPHGFPVEALAEAAARIFSRDGTDALQYASSEGYAPLREAIAAGLPWAVDPSQVLLTTGSQQALDLLGKVLIDTGSRVLLETPSYPGALQAFAPMEPTVVPVPSDEQGALPQALQALRGAGVDKARLLYVQPNFHNPTGRTMGLERRQALVEQASALHLPIVEDDPYGELWMDAPPAAPLTALWPEGCVYVGSFSKILAPGLRVGYLVAPRHVYSRLLLAKQAADLHSPGLCQRLVYELLHDGTLQAHIPRVRALYRSQRDAMVAALEHWMAPLEASWNTPQGGMFVWLRLPAQVSATAVLEQALARQVAVVPGTAFTQDAAGAGHVRLSYATATPAQMHQGIEALAQAVMACMPAHRRRAA